MRSASGLREPGVSIPKANRSRPGRAPLEEYAFSGTTAGVKYWPFRLLLPQH